MGLMSWAHKLNVTLCAAWLSAVSLAPALAQTSPGFVPNQTLGASQLNSAFQAKQDYPVVTQPKGTNNTTAATTAYVQNELRIIHSLDYAKGDGTTDDTVNLQNWINACQGIVPATVCYLDSAYYKITAELNITSCINIDGAGRSSAFFLAFGATQNTLHINTTCQFGRIANVGFKPSVTKTGGAAILLDGASTTNGWTLDTIFIVNEYECVKSTVNMILLTLDKVTASGSNNCLDITNGGDATVTNSWISGTAVGLLCTNCDGMRVANSKFIENTSLNSVGIEWVGTAACISCSDLLLANNSIEVGAKAVVIAQGTAVSMANVSIVGGEYASSDTAITIADDSNSWLQRVSVAGAVIVTTGNSDAPLVVGSANGVALSGNTITGNATSNYGISIRSAVGTCVISGNSIIGTVTGTINDASGKCQKAMPSTVWTPILKGASVAGTPTYTTQVGSYVQSGSLVTAWFNIVISAKTGISGNLQIGGLPVTSGSTANDLGSCLITEMSGMTLTTNYVSVAGIVQPSVTNANLVQNGSAQSAAALTDTNLGSTATLIGKCDYHN